MVTGPLTALKLVPLNGFVAHTGLGQGDADPLCYQKKEVFLASVWIHFSRRRTTSGTHTKSHRVLLVVALAPSCLSAQAWGQDSKDKIDTVWSAWGRCNQGGGPQARLLPGSYVQCLRISEKDGLGQGSSPTCLGPRGECIPTPSASFRATTFDHPIACVSLPVWSSCANSAGGFFGRKLSFAQLLQYPPPLFKTHLFCCPDWVAHFTGHCPAK